MSMEKQAGVEVGGTPGRLEIEHRRVDSLEAVRASVAAAGGAGWICTTAMAQPWPQPEPDDAPILAAEIALSERESIHVRCTEGGWLLTRLREAPGTEHRAFDDEFQSTEDLRGPGRLMLYRTWWRCEPSFDGIAVWTPFASRFVGWRER